MQAYDAAVALFCYRRKRLRLPVIVLATARVLWFVAEWPQEF